MKDVPDVGENLQDHVAAYGLTWTTSAKGTAYNPFLYTLNPLTYIKWKLWKTGNFVSLVRDITTSRKNGTGSNDIPILIYFLIRTTSGSNRSRG